MNIKNFVGKLSATPQGRSILVMVKTLDMWRQYKNFKKEGGDYTPAEVAEFIYHGKPPVAVNAPGEYPGKKPLIEVAKPGALLDFAKGLANKLRKTAVDQ